MSMCFHLVLKQVNVVVVVIISIIHMQKFGVANAVKVFNLIRRSNETKHREWHQACKCECKFVANVIISNIGIKINADVNAKN